MGWTEVQGLAFHPHPRRFIDTASLSDARFSLPSFEGKIVADDLDAILKTQPTKLTPVGHYLPCDLQGSSLEAFSVT